MIFGVSPTQDAVVIARATGSGETFVIKSIRSIQFQARSGDGLKDLLQRLVAIFDLSGTRRRSTIALLGSSSGRFKSSVEAIKGEAITELAAAKSGAPVVRVTAASLKKVLGCAPGQKWQARAEERFNPGALVRTGRTAQLALRLPPSRSLGTADRYPTCHNLPMCGRYRISRSPEDQSRTSHNHGDGEVLPLQPASVLRDGESDPRLPTLFVHNYP
jgi:hypothetical protein